MSPRLASLATGTLVVVLAVLVIVTVSGPKSAADSQSPIMKGFYVASPLVATSDPRVRDLLPRDAGYRWMRPGGGAEGGTVRLTWRPDRDAYAYLYGEDTDPDAALYRPSLLADGLVLWQSAAPADSGDGAQYRVFVTRLTAGTIVPVSFRQDELARALGSGHATVQGVVGDSPLAGFGGMGVIAGQPAAIRTALATTAANHPDTALSIVAVPAGQ